MEAQEETRRCGGARLTIEISRIERNPESCTVRTLRKLAKALKVDVATFLR